MGFDNSSCQSGKFLCYNTAPLFGWIYTYHYAKRRDRWKSFETMIKVFHATSGPIYVDTQDSCQGTCILAPQIGIEFRINKTNLTYLTIIVMIASFCIFKSAIQNLLVWGLVVWSIGIFRQKDDSILPILCRFLPVLKVMEGFLLKFMVYVKFWSGGPCSGYSHEGFPLTPKWYVGIVSLWKNKFLLPLITTPKCKVKVQWITKNT